MAIRQYCRFAEAIAAAFAAGMLQPAVAGADDSGTPMFSLRGFGTLGEVYSDARNADFVGNFFQPNGAGFTRSWAAGVDSKLGLQGDAHIGDKLSAILQVVSQLHYDDTWAPRIDYANVKYQFTSDFSMHLGRTVSDFFMLSDTRLVGYTYTWVRPPEEIYGQSPVTNQDGIGFNYRLHFGGATNSVNVTYGKASVRIPRGGNARTVGRFFAGSSTLERGAISVRIGYTSFLGDFDTQSTDALFSGLAQFAGGAASLGFPETGARALALHDKYRLEGFRYSIATASLDYDPGDWLLMAELAKVSATTAISDSTAGYVTGGYRFGKVTPYMTLARVKADTKREPGISTAGLPPPLAVGATNLNAGITAVIDALAVSQESFSLGVRWDVMKNIDLKAQYDRVRLGSSSSGRLGNVQPNFQPGGEVNVLSLAVDFVF